MTSGEGRGSKVGSGRQDMHLGRLVTRCRLQGSSCKPAAECHVATFLAFFGGAAEWLAPLEPCKRFPAPGAQAQTRCLGIPDLQLALRDSPVTGSVLMICGPAHLSQRVSLWATAWRSANCLRQAGPLIKKGGWTPFGTRLVMGRRFRATCHRLRPSCDCFTTADYTPTLLFPPRPGRPDRLLPPARAPPHAGEPTTTISVIKSCSLSAFRLPACQRRYTVPQPVASFSPYELSTRTDRKHFIRTHSLARSFMPSAFDRRLDSFE